MPQDPGYADVAAETPDKGIFSNAGKGDGDIINDAGSDANAMIYGDNGTEGNGIDDDVIWGSPEFDPESSDNADDIDAAIWGTNDPQDDVAGSALTDADIYGEPDEPAPKKRKVYRVVKRNPNKPVINPNPQLGGMNY